MNYSDYKIFTTTDGSNTLFSDIFNQYYHSVYGAKTESEHIFINNGFYQVNKRPVKIFEMGFGSGLNAILTAAASYENKTKTIYHAVDIKPFSGTDILSIHRNLIDDLNKDFINQFINIQHNKPLKIHKWFELTVNYIDINEFNFPINYNLVYFDAFSPDKQPELWTTEIFRKIISSLENGGLLLTYCSKGSVKNALRQAGFEIKRMAGPPGKRHIIKAIKQQNY